MTTGRLAPTPSGHLHLGNVCAFAAAWLSIRQQQGRLVLRMEDVDRARARPDIEASQRDDLRWLGLEWDEETPRQSERDYRPWLECIRAHTYRCTCTRREIRATGGVYRGTCRDSGHRSGAVRFRLPADLPLATDRAWGPIPAPAEGSADPVLRRRDGLFSYNLAVVVDDIADGVTEVVRGADLLEMSRVQSALWLRFGATPPTWLHAPLVRGPDGRKLSKSHGSLHIGALRAAGATPSDIWRRVLPWLGVHEAEHVHQALPHFAPDRWTHKVIDA